ncbi:S8 family serine peptidase [Zobellia barbeyronii]|uniref:S8 family serine peptidase n=1 Tax=Zobellia barbeyronii TaxID=2748009 RepID=A0ABS5W9Y2_9FLAO|nr:S8 family serine peptidase [Zobellia barbeyronii]MBT2159625.1 S8 family serine peptidase [Zobellia barbeyronii]
MKTKITFLLLLTIILSSCTKLPYGQHIDDDTSNSGITYDDIRVDEGISSEKKNIFMSPNNVIVKYQPQVTPEERKAIRETYPIIEFKQCDCGDTNIELWIFDPNIPELEIEGVVERLSRTSPRGTTRGERSFDIELSPVGPYTVQGQGQGVDGEEEALIANAGNSKINIAVIDTGLDFYRYLFTNEPKKFLFPSGGFGSCYPTTSGWNFTQEPNNRYFADGNGHGTYITKIITDELDSKNLNYSILPLKVFDDAGKGSYWNVLCALSYIKQLNQNGANISIVNASFGGEMPREIFEEPAPGDQKNIFAQTIEDLNRAGALVITSAGNDNKDVDQGPNGDFISSFRETNILTVGGYEYDTINPGSLPIRLHPLSNYGSKGSIDIALAFNDYRIILDNSDPSLKNRVTLQGTSYATAAMSGIAGLVINQVGRVPAEELKNLIFNLAIEAPELDGKIDESRVIPRATN